MATHYPVPAEAALQSLIGDLIGAETHIARAEVADPPREATGIFAEYINDDDELAVLGYADAVTSNSVGGALVDASAESIHDANENAMLLDDSLEGMQEVMNILSSCLNSDYTKHLRLRAMCKLPGQLADDVKTLWRNPLGRRSYSVTVEGHQAGSLILYLG